MTPSIMTDFFKKRENLNAVTNADMTFPSADNERLILVASFSLSPVAPVFD